jgi:hypothetical protein
MRCGEWPLAPARLVGRCGVAKGRGCLRSLQTDVCNAVNMQDGPDWRLHHPGAKEASAVKGALRRLSGPADLPGVVGGGLVFTHGEVSFRGDDSCRAWVGRPSSCAETLRSSPEIPNFAMEKRLRVLDVLLEWSDRLHDLQGEARWETSSSIALAERLYDESVSRAAAYCSQMGEHAAVSISEEAKEARKRAFWYPHPDDPANP